MVHQNEKKDYAYGSIDNVEAPQSQPTPGTGWSSTRWLQVNTVAIGILIVIALQGHRAENQAENQTLDQPRYFDQQLVDHFDSENNQTWSHPYFVSDTHFAGPGHPILVIIGGEGPVTNILYPFVSEKMAKDFGAFVLQTEHRFYGHSQPVGYNVSNRDFDLYLSPEQALADWILLIRHVQVKLGCAIHDKTSPNYCPVVTIGGSYPGFLSAMMRLNYPKVVDVGYASSAPLKLYEHSPDFDGDGYYDFVTKVAEKASPGCIHGVSSTLQDIHQLIVSSDFTTPTLAKMLGICEDTFPAYMETNDILARELTMLVVASYADFNMDYYPPSNETDLVKACRIFSDESNTPVDRYAKFLELKAQGGAGDDGTSTCFDLMTEIPAGPNATISSADWSGAGDGETGRSWEFQICRDLVVQTGFGPKSMFYPPREWTLEWLTNHCQSRFQVTPQPRRMLNMWHFDDLVNKTSRILFTNGLNDGWSVSSYTEDLSDSILALNFTNGAHHSDLGHVWPTPGETDDIKQGHMQIIEILRGWLSDLEE